MLRVNASVLSILTISALGTIVNGQDAVTIDNFCRAETDRYLQERADDDNFGRIKPRREPVTVDNQPVVRANRDTLYSYGVFDLTHTVTITMPDAGERFMSLKAINQDHYIVSNTYASGPYEFTQESVGTRYLYVCVRTLVNPDDPKGLAQPHALQDHVPTRRRISRQILRCNRTNHCNSIQECSCRAIK